MQPIPDDGILNILPEDGDTPALAPWCRIWRLFAQRLPVAGLHALRIALATDSPLLVQGATTSPPPLRLVQDWPVEAADPAAFALWQGLGLTTVEEVESAWARLCADVDNAAREPAACRHWINHWDESPRGEVVPQLLAEVEWELTDRGETVEPLERVETSWGTVLIGEACCDARAALP
jgi:hypothetical protein